MLLAVLLYTLFAIICFIDVMFAIAILEYVRQAVSVKERPKLASKIVELKEIKKYSFVWPYVLYKIFIKK